MKYLLTTLTYLFISLHVSASPITSAEITSSKLISVNTKFSGVQVTIKNTGATQVRSVKAVISFFNASGGLIEKFDYYVYANSKGIAPGDIWVSPNDDAVTYPKMFGAESVSVTVLSTTDSEE